ncbi:hypothetical protein Agabi119p4_11275 [Agaricus bisporus var. burnettii]|uniref:Uncharacterized protein n=1 Tax=Agaricus bisporus var. burnettii TaxID=192524 RepID=A0A8H7EW06_AGABI|nr:hypothetical protein Agabi119p4_11275 [Agaricus bisporus var. burnettii]
MQVETGNFTPYAVNTLVRLTTDVEGLKFVGNQWVDHTLPAGTLASITECVRQNTRTSINNDPLSSEDFGYKLKSTVTENFVHNEIEPPVYTGRNESQKIGHTALDTQACPPQGPKGMYEVGEMTRILPGHEYKYGLGSGAATLRGGDIISIHVEATTRSGSPSVRIPKHAYYLQVQRVKRSMVPRQITWRSKRIIESLKFEVVQDLSLGR